VTLLKQQWKNDRGNLLGWSLLIAFVSWLLVYMFWIMADTGIVGDLNKAVESMPPALRAVWGLQGTALTVGSWIEAMLYHGLFLVVFAIYTSLYVAGLITREADQRNLEFLLSLPVGRDQVLLTRWSGLIGGLAVLTLVHWLAIAVAAGAEVSRTALFWADVNMFLVFAALGGLLLVVSLFIDDYPRGVGISMGISLLLFFISTIEGSQGVLAAVQKMLPFHYLNPAEIIGAGHVPARDLLVLAAASLVFLGLAVQVFRRKQIAS